MSLVLDMPFLNTHRMSLFPKGFPCLTQSFPSVYPAAGVGEGLTYDCIAYHVIKDVLLYGCTGYSSVVLLHVHTQPLVL